MTTYNNQKIIYIEKDSYQDNFLQIGIAEWQAAYKSLTPSAFALYLYLASNNNGYSLALSRRAVEDAIGLSKNTYHRAIDELVEKNYLVHQFGNEYIFST